MTNTPFFPSTEQGKSFLRAERRDQRKSTTKKWTFQSSRSIPNSSFHLVQTLVLNRRVLHLVTNHCHWCCSCQKGFVLQLFRGSYHHQTAKYWKKIHVHCLLFGYSCVTLVWKGAGLSFEMKRGWTLLFWRIWCFDVSRTLPDFCIPFFFFLYPLATILCIFWNVSCRELRYKHKQLLGFTFQKGCPTS